ncbi:MAG TPA: hypothetical protein VKQ52_00275 [Puia sp.]|nr:hypothetical protein [Puia sp.]
MKNSILIALFCVGLLPAQAQKIVEKHLPFAANGFVSMNFQISDSIRILTWKKNEVYVHSSIDVNDNQNNDDYTMVFDETGNTISVSGKLETEKIRRSRKDSSGNHHYNGDCCCCCNWDTRIIHEVYIPENADFSVETINGNIIITGNTAEIKAHSISGYIDLAIAPDRKAEVKMHTISGTMYSNIELPSASRGVRHVGGGSVTADLNGGGKRIDLETISGNIFFRKES